MCSRGHSSRRCEGRRDLRSAQPGPCAATGCRGFARQVAKDVGPVSDVPAPDVMTNARNTCCGCLMSLKPSAVAAFPGSSPASRSAWAARSAELRPPAMASVFTLREALKELRLKPENTSASVQGFGNVAADAVEAPPATRRASHYSVLLGSWGPVLLYLSQATRNQPRRTPLDYRQVRRALIKIRPRHWATKRSAGEAWLEQEVDILDPGSDGKPDHRG